jgi:hypothetical protein
MQQRYYDPEIGRFDSVDAVTAYEKPLTHFNRYLYVLNNPYRFVDPDGRTYEVKGDPDAVANRLVKQLEKTPTGAALVKSVKESKQNAVITVETKGKNITNSSDQNSSAAGKPTDAKVHINVDSKINGPDTTGSRRVDPFVNVGHEFGHVDAIFNGTQNFDVGNGSPGTTPPSEVKNLEIENAIRSESGIPLRASYN